MGMVITALQLIEFSGTAKSSFEVVDISTGVIYMLSRSVSL